MGNKTTQGRVSLFTIKDQVVIARSLGIMCVLSRHKLWWFFFGKSCCMSFWEKFTNFPKKFEIDLFSSAVSGMEKKFAEIRTGSLSHLVALITTWLHALGHAVITSAPTWWACSQTNRQKGDSSPDQCFNCSGLLSSEASQWHPASSCQVVISPPILLQRVTEELVLPSLARPFTLHFHYLFSHFHDLFKSDSL